MLAGVLTQCTALTHLDLSESNIEAVGAGWLAGVLALVHLHLGCNQIVLPGQGIKERERRVSEGIVAHG